MHDGLCNGENLVFRCGVILGFQSEGRQDWDGNVVNIALLASFLES